MRMTTRMTIELLADRPELTVPLAGIRYAQWGGEPDRERLVVTWVARDAGTVLRKALSGHY